jgi:hypothetical protein
MKNEFTNLIQTIMEKSEFDYKYHFILFLVILALMLIAIINNTAWY